MVAKPTSYLASSRIQLTFIQLPKSVYALTELVVTCSLASPYPALLIAHSLSGMSCNLSSSNMARSRHLPSKLTSSQPRRMKDDDQSFTENATAIGMLVVRAGFGVVGGGGGGGGGGLFS